MQTPTIKVGEYRGVTIYVRQLARETFEYLIAMDGQIFANQVEMRREAGKRFAKYSDEDLESVVSFLLGVAHDFVDDRLFKQEQERKWKNRFAKARQKVADWLFHWKYVAWKHADNIKTFINTKNNERKLKRGKSN